MHGKAGGKQGKPDAQHHARRIFRRHFSGNRGGQELGNTGHGHNNPDFETVIASNASQHQRHQINTAIKPDTQRKAEHAAHGEIAIGKGFQIHNRLFIGKHPPEEIDPGKGACDGAINDRGFVKPVILGPFVKDIFKAAQKHRHRQKPAQIKSLKQADIPAIHAQRHGDNGGNHQSGNNVDQKQPVPGQ